MKIVIIGGVAGGATAAARLRRLSEEDEIIILERDEYISYANCGLPYYIGGVITEKQKLQVQTVKGMSERFNLDIRVKNEVISIDKDKKTVKIKKLDTDEIYEESYDKLIMSCGAKPIKPEIEGIKQAKNVFTLRNIPDTYAIKDYVTDNSAKKAVVIGGGFIGIEMAENFAELGIEVTLVEKLNQVLRPFDFEMAQIIHSELNNNGVELILGDGIKAFTEDGKKVVLESGNTIDTDITVLAIGVTPENTLAKNIGINLGARGHIKVNDKFNVSDSQNLLEDIYAIGDMIEVINPLDNSEYAVPLAWGANRQGRLLADIIHGKKTKKSAILGASVLKVFNLTAASVGSNEATLKQKGIEYLAIHAHRANHASYYPDSSNIALKLLYNQKSGKIYGAQAIGRDGTEKRIDVLSTVMRFNGTVYDLSDLELCYAPPFSSAKDPVNILGYIAENIADNAYKVAYHDEIDNIISDGGTLIDVRSEFEYNAGHIDGSKNIDVDLLRDSIAKIDVAKDKPLYITCRVGLRGYLAANILRDNGFKNIYNLSGGYLTYQNYKYHLNSPEKHKEAEVNDLQSVNNNANIKEINVTGIQCPGPLMATYKALESMNIGEKLQVTASDCGFKNDIDNWCESNGHKVLSNKVVNGNYVAVVQKGQTNKNCIEQENQKNASIIVFSGELDKVLAAMIIAQGAAAQGKNVTVFFTFWGLNALRKDNKVKVKKSFIEKMFGSMMPRGAKRLKLSNMNMLGMGGKMIRGIMKKKNVDDLPSMIKKAQEVGVHMIACTMSMDLMGIKPEELIEGVDFAGVATYISKNENVGTTLFI